MKKNDSVVFTRIMFCEKCRGNKMPQKGQYFLTIGDTKKELKVHRVTQNGHFGFTPHIITFDRILKDGRIVVIVSCGMISCGWEILNRGEESATVECLEGRRIVMEALQYSALKKYKDETYRLD